MRKIEFREEQKFTQWWLWLIFTGLAIIPVYGIYKQLILGEQFGDNPMPDAGLIIFAILIFAALLLFWRIRLKTEIDQHEIRMRFFPFTKKSIPWEEIKSAETVNYGFVGGWGIRLGTKYGTVYNTSGNKGVAIELKNGRKFCIGTQKVTELDRIIEKCLPADRK
ncbi:MAG: hypothetical protein WCI71_11210 [Bacteroidota bacterium]